MSKNFYQRRSPRQSKAEQAPPSHRAAKPAAVDLKGEKTVTALRNHMRKDGYRPATIEQIAKTLGAEGQQWLLLRQAAVTLEKLDELISDERGCLRLRSLLTVKGRLSVHPKGFGFLQSDDQLDLAHWRGELFISKANRLGAIQGDLVKAQIYTHNISAKGPEGRVLEILHREHQTAVATLAAQLPDGLFEAYSSLFPGKPIALSSSRDLNATCGDRVLFRLADHFADKSAPQEPNEMDRTKSVGTIEKIFGSIHNAALDIPVAIVEFGLNSHHHPGAIAEAKSFGSEVLDRDKVGRADLRAWEIFTIDPETAKDFDDALSLQVVGNRYQLGVHIADVAHFVSPGSTLDREAVKRCNSTYFPGTCLSMLPHELSDHLCSLKPEVERLTVSVLMQFDEAGELVHHSVVRSVIKSQCRYTYSQARALIQGRTTSRHSPTLLKMVQLCKFLKEQRRQRGSIDLAIPEWVIKCDETGDPTGMELHEYDLSHQLVEEFMLKANEIVAKTLSNRNCPLIFRIHESPSDEVMENFSTFAAAFGCELKRPIEPPQLQKLFASIQNEPFAPQLFISYIRSLKQAMYDVQNSGHYGLCLDHYCHFTSPIRRYADLTVMRALFSESKADERTLAAIAKTCSETERISARAEISVLILKKLRLLKAKLSAGQSQFQALITKVRPFGIYFELQALMLEGFLHISNLGNEYLQFDAKECVLHGKSGNQFTNGAKICPYLESVDLISLQTNWSLDRDLKRDSAAKVI